MIWNEELSASLDQSAGVVIFHRLELTRTQQLAQSLAEKVSLMVEQNEKGLDAKFGSTAGWNDRGDAHKGEKREQAQERRGRGDRTRGASRGVHLSICTHLSSQPYIIYQVGEVGVPDSLKAWAIRWQVRRHSARGKDVVSARLWGAIMVYRDVLDATPVIFHSSVSNQPFHFLVKTSPSCALLACI